MGRQPSNFRASLSEFEHVFVYGTLKRGQSRETCWPKPPQLIQDAWTLGKLIDLGPYPALLAGGDRVLGELWSFTREDIAQVFTVLDQVEVTNQPGIPNEYDRVQVRVTLGDGNSVMASTYRYSSSEDAARARLLQLSEIQPTEIVDGHSYVVWPSRSLAVD